jgi:hypothetical protein
MAHQVAPRYELAAADVPIMITFDLTWVHLRAVNRKQLEGNQDASSLGPTCHNHKFVCELMEHLLRAAFRCGPLFYFPSAAHCSTLLVFRALILSPTQLMLSCSFQHGI